MSRSGSACSPGAMPTRALGYGHVAHGGDAHRRAGDGLLRMPAVRCPACLRAAAGSGGPPTAMCRGPRGCSSLADVSLLPRLSSLLAVTVCGGTVGRRLPRRCSALHGLPERGALSGSSCCVPPWTCDLPGRAGRPARASSVSAGSFLMWASGGLDPTTKSVAEGAMLLQEAEDRRHARPLPLASSSASCRTRAHAHRTRALLPTPAHASHSQAVAPTTCKLSPHASPLTRPLPPSNPLCPRPHCAPLPHPAGSRAWRCGAGTLARVRSRPYVWMGGCAIGGSSIFISLFGYVLSVYHHRHHHHAWLRCVRAGCSPPVPAHVPQLGDHHSSTYTLHWAWVHALLSPPDRARHCHCTTWRSPRSRSRRPRCDSILTLTSPLANRYLSPTPAHDLADRRHA